MKDFEYDKINEDLIKAIEYEYQRGMAAMCVAKDTSGKSIIKEDLMIIKTIPSWADREEGEFQYGLTEISTLRMTALLWETMSHEGETAWKPRTVHDLFKKPFVNNCPCCEFAFDPEYGSPDCQKCPMRDWWGKTYLYDQDAWEATPLEDRIYHCESMVESPYRIWMESDCFDMWRLAEEVSNLAKEALDWWLALKEMNE